MGKWENRPLATSKPRNRSSPVVAHVITSWISTNLQNLVTIPQGVSFSCMRVNEHQTCLLGFFFPGSSNSPQPRHLNRFSRVIAYVVKRRGSAQRCAFSGLENKSLTFTPRNSRKHPPFFGPDFDGTENFRPKTALQWGCCRVNLLNSP